MQTERGRVVSGSTVIVETKVLHAAEKSSEIKDAPWTIPPPRSQRYHCDDCCLFRTGARGAEVRHALRLALS
jgi:hypothetical protein